MKRNIDIEVLSTELASQTPRPQPPAEVEPEFFKPTPRMRKAKAAFLAACKGKLDQELTFETVSKHITVSNLQTWWAIPGFQRWFRRPEAVAERLQYLYHLRLDSIEQILEDDTGLVTARDKLAAGAELDKITKTITEAAGAIERGEGVGDQRTMEEKIRDAYEAAKTESRKISDLQSEKREPLVSLPKFN